MTDGGQPYIASHAPLTAFYNAVVKLYLKNCTSTELARLNLRDLRFFLVLNAGNTKLITILERECFFWTLLVLRGVISKETVVLRRCGSCT